MVKALTKKIYHDWGGNELTDLEYAVKWLISQKEIDANRIGVFGGAVYKATNLAHERKSYDE